MSSLRKMDSARDITKSIIQDRFMDIISVGKKIDEPLKNEMLRKDINPYFSFPTVALIELCKKSANIFQKRKVMYDLRVCVESFMEGKGIVFMDDEGYIGVLFSWDDRNLMQQIQNHVYQQLPHLITIAVGNPANSLANINQSYQQAIQSMQDKFYQGKGRIIYYNRVQKYVDITPSAPELDDIYQSLLSFQSEDEITECIESYFHSITKHGPVEVNKIFNISIRFLVHFESRLKKEAGISSESVSYDIMSILELDTFDEVKDFIIQYILHVQGFLNRNELDVDHKMKQILLFMEENCEHVTLCSLAEKVYMTPTYLSLLFKLNTGKTFIEQLTEIRIEKAKRLIKTTFYKNYEIAEKVGYSDSRYFSQIFKKKVGLSPSAYRESTHMKTPS